MSDGSDFGSFDWSGDDRRALDSIGGASPRTLAPSVGSWGSGHRGRRGGRRWRGGAPPEAPAFTRELQNDAQGWRKFSRLVLVWQKLVAPYLLPEEQALRLMQELQDEALLLVEFIDVDFFFRPDGVKRLLDHLGL